MHHRYYSPRLGHFLTPDFRASDIYDPTTVKEPYAYAGGNPILFYDPDGLEDEPKFAVKPTPKPGTIGHLLHFMRHAIFWNNSVSRDFYDSRDKAIAVLADAQAATVESRDETIKNLENNNFGSMEPGLNRLGAATDFYIDRVKLWGLGAKNGALTLSSDSVNAASMTHNALVLGIDQVGLVDPTIANQASTEIAPMVDVVQEKGIVPVMVEGVAQPVLSLGTNYLLAQQEGNYKAEFDFVSDLTQLELQLAPTLLGSGAIPAAAVRLGKLPRLPKIKTSIAKPNKKRFFLHQAWRDLKAKKLKKNRQFETVYRGTRFGTDIKAIRSGYLESPAMRNKIKGKNGLLSKFRHSLDSMKPPSPWVSVTSSKKIAKGFAGPEGIVFEFKVRKMHLNRAWWSPYPHELESLVKGGHE